jgi:hypothetical protein
LATKRTNGQHITVVMLVLLLLATGMLGIAGFAEGSVGCPNRTLTGFQASLPGCRAYEMVTPPYKEGFQFGAGPMSEDGSQIQAESLGNFLDPGGAIPEGSGTLGHFYRLVRAEAGWESIPLDAPFSRFPNLHEVPSLSPDFRSSLWFASVPGQSSEDIYVDMSGGVVTRVGPGAPPAAHQTALHFAGASVDLRYLLFNAHSANGAEENPLWPGDTTLGGGLPSLYEYAGTGNSEPGLVGVSDEGRLASVSESHLISDCGTVLGGGGGPEEEAYNAVSASGVTVFFTAMHCGGAPSADELYARINREKTIAISEPPLLSVPGRICTGACATAESVPGNRKAGNFAGASLDGSRVFFLTSQPLVDADTDNGVDLYAADIGEGRLTRLVQVSRGGEGDPTPGTGADVLGVARVSEDGSHVYFVAQGALTGTNREGRAPVAGEPNLYVSVEECPGGEGSCGSPVDRTSFVATLSGADGADWGSADSRPVQATPDGRYLVFQSTADLTPDQEGLPEAGQVFEYNAQAETLARVSHGQNGYNGNGNSKMYPATIPSQYYRVAGSDTRFTGLAVSADGSRVFFSSAAALTPRALEGFSSVYEYHRGEVSLIAGGHDVAAVNATSLIGTDESGRDVFFMTTDQLIPQDRDASADLYDARIDGGFAPPVESAPCAGDSCQGAARTPPPLLMPGVSSGVKEESPVEVTSSAGVKQKAKVTKKAKKPRKRRRSTSKRGRRKAPRSREGSKS